MRTANDMPQRAGRWTKFRQDVGVLLWCSFIAACAATMFFFAYFDPPLLAADESPPAWLADRSTAYAVGFFFFWAVCTIASFLTAYLLDTRGDSDRDPA